ncbi:MAG: hypothetical protein SW833_12225 [Cyanobacteriota bacterium]|nr:hypothetical protein [Cyanobacteriota bacterium]
MVWLLVCGRKVYWKTLQDYVARINALVASNETSFVIRQDTRKEWSTIFDIAIPGICVFSTGSVLVHNLKIETRTLDKTCQRLICQSKGLFGIRERNYPLENILRINIKEMIDKNGDKWYHLSLIVEENQFYDNSVPLRASATQNIEEEKKFAERVRDFLRPETPIAIVTTE